MRKRCGCELCQANAYDGGSSPSCKPDLRLYRSIPSGFASSPFSKGELRALPRQCVSGPAPTLTPYRKKTGLAAGLSVSKNYGHREPARRLVRRSPQILGKPMFSESKMLRSSGRFPRQCAHWLGMTAQYFQHPIFTALVIAKRPAWRPVCFCFYQISGISSWISRPNSAEVAMPERIAWL